MHEVTQDVAEALAAQAITPLPERRALSLVNANIAAPINAAVAANVLSDGSVAFANAQQYAPITQGLMLSNPLAGGTGG